jgi:hypothetical protein
MVRTRREGETEAVLTVLRSHRSAPFGGAARGGDFDERPRFAVGRAAARALPPRRCPAPQGDGAREDRRYPRRAHAPALQKEDGDQTPPSEVRIVQTYLERLLHGCDYVRTCAGPTRCAHAGPQLVRLILDADDVDNKNVKMVSVRLRLASVCVTCMCLCPTPLQITLLNSVVGKLLPTALVFIYSVLLRPEFEQLGEAAPGAQAQA